MSKLIFIILRVRILRSSNLYLYCVALFDITLVFRIVKILHFIDILRLAVKDIVHNLEATVSPSKKAKKDSFDGSLKLSIILALLISHLHLR